MKRIIIQLVFLFILFISSSVLFSQNTTTIYGTIKDDKGEALPFVTLVIKGTTYGTLTDLNGNYTLQVPDTLNTFTLFTSSLGFVKEQYLFKRASLNSKQFIIKRIE